MNFENISEVYGSEVNGSCYQGEVNISYGELVDIFGEPGDGDGYKVQREWVLKFDDGTIATVYDWKWGYEYNGDDGGTHYTMVPTWNIGGFNQNAVHHVLDIIKNGSCIEGEVVRKLLN